jgi:hypothetical protein
MSFTFLAAQEPCRARGSSHTSKGLGLPGIHATSDRSSLFDANSQLCRSPSPAQQGTGYHTISRRPRANAFSGIPQTGVSHINCPKSRSKGFRLHRPGTIPRDCDIAVPVDALK